MIPLALLATIALQAIALQAPDSVRGSRVSDSAVVAYARESPDAVRDTLRRLLARAAADSASDALERARRFASGYATAWTDSFFVRRVDFFARLSPAQRRTRTRADSLRIAGNAALVRHGVDAALRRWRASQRLFERVHDTAGASAALGNIGVAFVRRQELDSAQHYLARARSLASAVGDHRTATNAVAGLAEVSRMRGQLREARDLFARAEGGRVLTGDMRGLAADRNNIGLITQDLGGLAEARAAFESALALNRAHGHDAAAATNLVNLGNIASLQADFVAAAGHYREALAIYRAEQNEPDEAFVLHSLGALALRRGDYRTAIAILTDALAILGRTGPAVAEIAARQDLFSARAAIGDLQAARAELQRAERLAQAGASEGVERAELLARLAIARGDLEVAFNRFADAERQYARAAELARGAANAATRATAQAGLGMVLLVRQQYTRAQTALEAALRAHEAAGETRSAALSRLLVAYAARHRGDTALAGRALRRALDSLASVGDPVGQAAALGGQGDLELQNRLPLTAESLYTRGLALLRDRSAPDVAWQLHAGLARAAAAKGDLPETTKALQRAIAEIERVSGALVVEERRSQYLADKWDAYVQLAAIEHRRGQVEAAFAASERLRARQMLELLARGRVALPPAAGEFAEQEQDLRRRISELTRELDVTMLDATRSRGGSPSAEERGAALEALARAQEAYGDLLIRMRERHPAYASMVTGDVASLRDVQAALDAHDVLLEYLVGDSSAILFVVTRDRTTSIDLNVTHDALAALVDFARSALSTPANGADRDAWRAPMRRLYQQLLAPAEERGLLAGKRRLLVAPHAELHYLPFAALVSGERTQDVLVHRFAIEYIPSASVWLTAPERGVRTAGRRLLAFAPRVDRLPGSRSEVSALRRIYGEDSRVLIGAAATERAFRAEAPAHDVVHLATFGVLNKHNPLFSFVELSPGQGEDGRLEAHEVFGLTLNARLVVLSACQTGVGAGALADVPPGDDWVGLVRTFFVAGAANVVATLWPVEDLSTATFMELFHRTYAAGGSAGEALIDAQRNTARRAQTSHPFYWAGFALVSRRGTP